MHLRRPLHVVARQLAVNLVTGLVLGAAVGGAAYLWQGTLVFGLLLAGAVALSQVVAGLLGSTLPLLLAKLRLDPSLLSSPLVATAAQVVGFLFLLAGTRLFLHLLS
jgi:magnesium transporter